MWLRSRMSVVGVVICVALCLISIHQLLRSATIIPASASHASDNNPDRKTQTQVAHEAPHPFGPEQAWPPPSLDAWRTLIDNTSHPIYGLIAVAEAQFAARVARQSRTLEDAVAEYQRRNEGLPPPPGFDAWFAYAQARNVVMVDEYDSISAMVRPFWGLAPSVVRARSREALGRWGENGLLGVVVRDGRVQKSFGGRSWMRDALDAMMAAWVGRLPDLDLAFNIHDEPRVAVPADALELLLRRGNDARARLVATAAAGGSQLRSEWTKPRDRVNMRTGATVTSPTDRGINSGVSRAINSADDVVEMGIPTIGQTRFNSFTHQQVWHATKWSCAAETPARDPADAPSDTIDRRDLWSASPLGHVANWTAHSDPCVHPSLATKHGLFTGANVAVLVHDLMPVFSQSKMANFQDLLVPSPWYWADRVPYDAARDPEWHEKDDKLFWRGSTTGGFSRDGAWERSHRMRFVARINDQDGRERIIVDPEEDGEAGESNDKTPDSRGNDAGRSDGSQVLRLVRTRDYRRTIDVLFSEIGQCDAVDCAAMRSAFRLGHYSEREAAWHHKWLADLEGNAFSGRFHAFLRSRSLVLKLAAFREWHDDWLLPWLHFIPLSLDGDDWLDVVRTLALTRRGREASRRLAEIKRDWAHRMLRRVDLEVWFYRLLLEWGRVVDDRRVELGFVLPQPKKKS